MTSSIGNPPGCESPNLCLGVSPSFQTHSGSPSSSPLVFPSPSESCLQRHSDQVCSVMNAMFSGCTTALYEAYITGGGKVPSEGVAGVHPPRRGVLPPSTCSWVCKGAGHSCRSGFAPGTAGSRRRHGEASSKWTEQLGDPVNNSINDTVNVVSMACSYEL
jgi:hypothetical protein